MAELLERLATATEPDAELDADLHEALIGAKFFYSAALTQPAYMVKPYTGSVDAALDLLRQVVPDDYSWLIATPGYEHGKLRGKFGAAIHHPFSSGGGPCWHGFSEHSPAIALCAAALNAARDALTVAQLKRPDNPASTENK